RRAVWEAAGPFDSRFALYAQDLDLCLRAGGLGWRVAGVSASRGVHHHRAPGGGTGDVAPAPDPREPPWAGPRRRAARRRGAAAGRATARALAAGGAFRRGWLAFAALGGGEARRRAELERASLRQAAAAAFAAAREPAERDSRARSPGRVAGRRRT